MLQAANFQEDEIVQTPIDAMVKRGFHLGAKLYVTNRFTANFKSMDGKVFVFTYQLSN